MKFITKQKTKKYLMICAIVICFPVVSQAETILYCQSELETGFGKFGKIENSWRESSFEPERWTVKFNDNFSKVEGFRDEPMKCSVVYSHLKEAISCNGDFQTLTFSKESLRFVYFTGSSSYVGNKPDDGTDTESIYAGTCQEF